MIDKCELKNIAVVVTRYFGGTKLGVGGLVRAYGDAAEQALLKAENLTRYITQTFEATFPHSHISNVMHVVSKLGARMVETRYDNEVHMRLEIRLSRVEELKTALMNQTGGRVSLKVLEDSMGLSGEH
jgi:putative IMPACT (imprinted ancient) family translation regulator